MAAILTFLCNFAARKTLLAERLANHIPLREYTYNLNLKGKYSHYA